MQRYSQEKANSLLHSLARISCPFVLELVLASAILNCPQLLQSLHAQTLSKEQSILLSQTSLDEALIKLQDVLIESLSNNTNADTTWNNRGIELANQGQYQKALDAYDKAIQLNPKNNVAWYNRGVALYNLKRYQESLESYDKVIELPTKYIGAFWDWRGLTFYELKRYQEAFASYDKATKLLKENAYIWNRRGDALKNLNRYREAFESYDKASQLKPDEDYFWNDRGNALYLLGRYHEALDSYHKATQLKPNDSDYWGNHGVVLYRLAYYQEALDSFNKATQLKPNHVSFNWRGNALGKLGRYQESVAAYDKAIELKPNDDGTWSNRGWALDGQSRYQEAFESYDKASRINPDNSVHLYDKARLLVKLKRSKEAVAILNLILSKSSNDIQLTIDPANLAEAKSSKVKISRVFHLKGVALLELGELQESIAQFDKAISLNAYSLVSKVNFDLVKLDNDLGDYDSYYGKGSALVKLQRYLEALAAFNKAIELKPDFADAIKVREQLRKLI